MRAYLLLGLAAALGAGEKKTPPFHEELRAFTRPGYRIHLPKGFRDSAKWDHQLLDKRLNGDWLWGSVYWQKGLLSREQLQKFAAGGNCPAARGQKVFARKAVKTRNLLGYRLSCGDPEGRPYGDNPQVSGWTEIRGNSRRFKRHYIIHLDYWEDPRKVKVQQLIDRIVLSFKERGAQSLEPQRNKPRRKARRGAQ